MEWEIDGWIAVVRMLYRPVVVERESEAVDLLVHLRSCPHLRPPALGGYRNRNEVSGLAF